jgi:hypothetical protein
MGLDIQVNVDVGPASRFMSTIERQLPFAASKALNQTAKDVQAAERQEIRGEFSLRREQFVLRTVKIERGDWATKAKLEARVRIDRERDILAKFTRGGQKRALGGGHIAVPVGPDRLVRRTKRYPNIAARYGPFRYVGRSLRGEKRTFIIPSGPDAGVYQRVGRGKRSRLQLLYAFERSVRIPRLLPYYDVARRVVNRRWAPNFTKSFDEAIRTAKQS